MTDSAPAKSYKVLVVEDEGLIAHDIAKRLEVLGHTVEGPVSTAEEAISQASGADVVLMDIRIDGQRDGIDAALEIRARYHLPVIFLTAHADRSTLERAKQAGPFGYIVKPLGPASLHTAIEMAIAKHRVERLLEEREAWLRSTIACAADALLVANADGRVRLLNRAAEQLTGWTQTEAEGLSTAKVVRLIDAESAEEDADPIPLVLLRDAPLELNPSTRLISRDGREMEIEGFLAPVRTSAPPGELLGVVMTFRDTSAKRWEERQLRQAQRLEAAGRLAATAANEYTQLIAVIRKHTEHLLRQFGEYASARSKLEEIQQASVAADQITRRLAALGTRQMCQPELFSLNGLLRRMARLIEAAAGQRIRVAIRPAAGAGQIRADVVQIESAIMSLVAHAGAVMPEGGQVLIETAAVDLPHAGRTTAYTLTAITYSAVEPDIDRLFDPGAATDAGLALSLVHSVVTECGGHLSARSTPNGGSRIEMLIPRVSDRAVLPAPIEQPHSLPTVLLVDERDAVRAEIHNFFESAGCNLLEAADAAEAMALVEIHEGALDLLIAEAAQAGAIMEGLRASHTPLKVLRIVEGPENEAAEIRRPFTRQALLNKVFAILGDPVTGQVNRGAATSSS